jgi:hypothetical protein
LILSGADGDGTYAGEISIDGRLRAAMNDIAAPATDTFEKDPNSTTESAHSDFFASSYTFASCVGVGAVLAKVVASQNTVEFIGQGELRGRWFTTSEVQR